MSVKKFYKINASGNLRIPEASPQSPKYDYEGYEKCPLCGSPVSGGKWKRPHNVYLRRPVYPDFLYCTGADSPFLVSQRFKEEYEQSDLTGIDSFSKIDKLIITGKKWKDAVAETPNYYTIRLKRSCAIADMSQSKILFGEKHEHYCRYCDPNSAIYNFLYKIKFSTKGCEMFDIFSTYEFGDLAFISEKFIGFCNDKKITNLSYLDIEEGNPVVKQWFPELCE